MSGLTDAEREALRAALCDRISPELPPAGHGRDGFCVDLTDSLAPAVEQILAARETAAVEAFRARAVEAIEANAAAEMGEADHVTLGVIAAISEGKTRAARIVRHL